MSYDIQVLLRTLQLLSGQDGDPPVPDGDPPETPVVRVRGENGEVYFNLDWQTRQANDRQSRTNESYQPENFQPDNSGDDHSTFSNFRQRSSEATSFSTNSNDAQPEADGNHLYQTGSTANNSGNARNNSPNNANNYSNNSNYSNNNYASNSRSNSRSANWLQNQPENLRARIVQMSEPRTVELRIDGRIETRQISRFDELARKMENLKLTPQEFAKSLPREEREAFLARLQSAQTPNSSERVPQTTNGKTQIENKQNQLSENQNQGDKSSAQLAARQIKSGGNLSARTVEQNTFDGNLQTASDKASEISKNIVLPDKSFNAPSGANLKTANAAPNLTGAETFNARILNNLNNARTENSVAAGVLTRREMGVVLGGALVNGAFAAVGEHEHSENSRVGDKRGNGNFYDARHRGFAAGATGALLSAAIGRVIPAAGTDVSGVLGFVSGVVVGVEIDEGLRWLGAAKSQLAAANIFQLNDAGDFISNVNLLPGFA